MAKTDTVPAKPAPAHTSVRDVEPELWRRLRAAALFRNQNVGELLNEVIREWLSRHPS